MAIIKDNTITISVRRIVSFLLGQETLRISARTSFRNVNGGLIFWKDFSISDKIRQACFSQAQNKGI
jgi:hypothetical protein